ITSLPNRTNHYLIQIHTTFRDGCDVLNAHLLQDRSPNKLFTTTKPCQTKRTTPDPLMEEETKRQATTTTTTILSLDIGSEAGTPNCICRPLQISSNSPTATEGGRSVVMELSYLATRRRHKATVGDLQKGKSDLTKALTLKADSHLHRPASDLHIDQREPEKRRAKIKREQGRSGNASGSVETVAGASSYSSEFSSVLSP
ncbi:unnamed protein product, partial [Brassica oleracea var. botrytis]